MITSNTDLSYLFMKRGCSNSLEKQKVQKSWKHDRSIWYKINEILSLNFLLHFKSIFYEIHTKNVHLFNFQTSFPFVYWVLSFMYPEDSPTVLEETININKSSVSRCTICQNRKYLFQNHFDCMTRVVWNESRHDSKSRFVNT